MNAPEYTDKFTTWLIDHGIKILVILAVVYIIQKVVVHFVEKTIRKIIKNDPNLSEEAEVKREDTLIGILSGTIKIVVWTVVLLMILSEVGINIGPFIAGAGIIGLAFGFGGQYLIRDLISGLFIILENQYRIGDAVEIAGLSGQVEKISLRATVLRDLDGVVHNVPHGEITTVSNKSMGISKINIDFGISYSSDIDKAREMINEVGLGLSKDDKFGKMIEKAPEFLRVQELADSAVILKITGVTRPGKQFAIKGEFLERLKKESDKRGIEMPFPQMVIHQAK